MGRVQMNPFGHSHMDVQRLLAGAQGTMGIATWATLKCCYLSKLNRALLAPSASIEPLIDLSYRLVRFRLGGSLFILNGLNLACLLAQTAREIEELKAILPPWALVVSFEGYGELPEEKVQYQEADFRDMARSCHLEPLTTIPGASAEDLSSLLSLPSAEPYWKLRFQGGCHDIFFLTTLDKTPGFMAAVCTLAQSHRFPIENTGVYIQPMVQGTSCHLEFNLYSDPSKKIELDRAKWLVNEGSRDLAKQGGFFSRPYGAWADFAYSGATETVVMQRKMKKIFDPNGILNPDKLRL